MRMVIGAVVLVLGGVVTASQQPTLGNVLVGSQSSQSDMTLTIACGQSFCGSASMPVSRSEFYVGGSPTVGLGVRASGSDAPELRVIMRAWKEGDGSRVVIFARRADAKAPDGATETPIATFTIVRGHSVEVREAERWGGPLVLVSAQ